MSRDDRFATADVDTGFFSDPKVHVLAKRLGDAAATATHLCLYQATILESWASADRVTLDDAAPPWSWNLPLDAIRVNLAAVGLLDPDGRIPERAWQNWFQVAWDRREVRRKAGKLGGVAKASRSTSSDSASSASPEPSEASDPATRSVPIRSSPVRTDPPARRAREATEEVFEWIETRGVQVNRTNGHARMLRSLVEAHGAAKVLATLGEIDSPIANAGDVAKFVSDALRPRPATPSSPPSKSAQSIEDERQASRDRIQRQRVTQYWNTGIWDPGWGDEPKRGATDELAEVFGSAGAG